MSHTFHFHTTAMNTDKIRQISKIQYFTVEIIIYYFNTYSLTAIVLKITIIIDTRKFHKFLFYLHILATFKDT